MGLFGKKEDKEKIQKEIGEERGYSRGRNRITKGISEQVDRERKVKNYYPHKEENKLMTGKRRVGRRDRKIKGKRGGGKERKQLARSSEEDGWLEEEGRGRERKEVRKDVRNKL